MHNLEEGQSHLNFFLAFTICFSYFSTSSSNLAFLNLYVGSLGFIPHFSSHLPDCICRFQTAIQLLYDTEKQTSDR
jgi:hypothetical protein